MTEEAGGIKPFDCVGEGTSLAQRWERWLRGFEYFIGSTGITAAARKRDTLLYKAGMDVQDVYHALPAVTPAEGEDVYTVTVKALTDKFTPRCNIPYERIKFRALSQNEDETIASFEVRLRRQALYCGFGALLDEQLRDQILDKVFSRELKRKLIEIGPEMTLQSVLETSRNWEDANCKERDLARLPDTKPVAVNRVEEGSSAKFEGKKVKCFACGYFGHVKDSSNCPALKAKCRLCKQLGHFQACCKKTKKKKNQEKKKKVANLQGSSSESETESETEENPKAWSAKDNRKYNYSVAIRQMNSIKDDDLIQVNIGGVRLKVMVDSGASCNVIDEGTWSALKDKNFDGVSFVTKQKLYPYGRTKPLTVLSKFKADVQVVGNKEHREQATFFVIKGKGVPLLGRETSMKLGVLKIGVNLMEKSNRVGKLKDFQIKLPIKKEVQPVRQPLRRIPVPIQEKLDEKLRELEDLDIIEKIDGPTEWSSQLVVVPKPNGDLRICVDMRQANTAIEREKHHIPSFDELLPDLRTSQFFSKLDVEKAFHQLELSPESRDITTFLTHKGLYRYKRLMFGISCAPDIFQRTMEELLKECEGTHIYIDDILVHGKTKEEHDIRLKKVLTTLEEKGITLNSKKCVFGVQAVEFMGHKLSVDGVAATENKIKAVCEFREPKNAEEVRSFLGLVNFVGRFIPNLSTITEPLRRLVKKDQRFVWKEEQRKAFKLLKNRLTEARTLGFYDPAAKTTVISDASPVGLGAVLIQESPQGPRVISYASKSLTDPETRYSQNEKEALALVWSCEHFHMYLYGRDTFDLITDNKPIECIFSPKGKPNARVERWVMRLQAYNYRVIHRPGKSNIADPLSRLVVKNKHDLSVDQDAEHCLRVLVKESVPVALKLRDLEEEFGKDSELQAVSRDLETGHWGESTKSYHVFASELSQVGNVLLRGNRLIIPVQLRQRALELAHEGHLGMSGMKSRMRCKVWWPKIDRDCEKFVKNCHGCQITSTPDVPEPIRSTQMPFQPWQDLALDFLGPLPSGHSLLVIIDYYSRFFEVEIMKSTTTEKTIQRLKPMFARYGLPMSIRTDNGPQFASSEFQEFCLENNIEHRFTTPLWPQANGEIERQNRSLLKRLRIAQGTGEEWKEILLKYLMAYRSTPHSTTGVSPADLMFKRSFRDKLPSIEGKREDDGEVRDRDQERKYRSKVYADKSRRAQDSVIAEGDLVLMKQTKTNKLSTPYNPIPNTVIERNGSSITVQTPDKSCYTRNSTFFKKYNCPEKAQIENTADQPDSSKVNISSEDKPILMPTERNEVQVSSNPATTVVSRPIRERRKPLRYQEE